MNNSDLLNVKFSYLDRQFSDIEPYLSDIAKLVSTGDFTLGSPVEEFESKFSEISGIPYAIGVGSGTDALILSLKALGIGPGDEVITTPMTFIATVGAIAMAGARPVFVDSEEGFVIDAEKIESKITSRTKAILPVHYTGNVADMPAIMKIADEHGLLVIEDAAQSILGKISDKPVGSWGSTACFSLHPLKNLNVWGDAGVILTQSEQLAADLRLLRNHGLKDRDHVSVFGHNSRLDSIQAVVGNRLINQANFITEQRIRNASKYDQSLKELKGLVSIPTRRANVKHTYHLYMIRVTRRDELHRYLNERGVEAKIHYPIPVHLQEAARHLGYQEGDFPVCESDCQSILTLPVHEHLTTEEADYTIDQIRLFYEHK